MYAEINNNSVLRLYSNLPVNYKNISNFFTLEPELLLDLGWSGNEGVKFYPYIEKKPELPPNSQYVGPTYTIDEENKQVIGTFEVVPIEPIAPQIPDSISARQIRLWLIQNGISLQNVTDSINTIEDKSLRESIFVEWEYVSYIEKNHPMLVPLAQILGLSEEDVNRAFLEASNI